MWECSAVKHVTHFQNSAKLQYNLEDYGGIPHPTGNSSGRHAAALWLNLNITFPTAVGLSERTYGYFLKI